MRGLNLWVVIIAVLGSVVFPASVAFGELSIAKGPTPGGLYIIGPGHDHTYPLYYSPDYGDTLIPMDSTSGFMGNITADASEGGVYCISGGGGLYYSQDYGINWTYKNGGIGPITGGCFAGEIFCGFTFSADYGSTLTVMEANGFEGWFRDATAGRQVGEYYVMNDRGQLYFSTEYGDTFNLKHDFGYPQGRFWSLRRGAVSGEVYLLCRTSGQLYYSSDYGETFEEKKQFPGEGYFWGIDMVGGVNQGDVFVERHRIYYEGGGEIQIYYSADYGSTFVEYKHKFNAVKEEQEGRGLPRAVELGQNWPNPFNSATTLHYTFPPQVIGERFKVKGDPNTYRLIPITLKIYNNLGQEVVTLVDERQRAGYYRLVWDGKNKEGKEVSSGVYFCQLKAGRFNQTRKMLLLR